MLNRHKHILVFISILGILLVPVGDIMTIQGRFAKGDETSLVPVPEDNISIWDSGTTSVNDPYNAQDLFEYSNNFWGDLFDDGRFNNVAVEDNQRYLVELAVSKYVSTHADEEVNGVMTSYFDDIVNHVMSNPSDFDMYWTPDGFVSALTGNPYMNLNFGDDFYDNLYDYVIANYYSVPSPDVINTGSGIWVATPYQNSRGFVGCDGGTVYASKLTNGNTIFASYITSAESNVLIWFRWSINGSNAATSGLAHTYDYNGTTYRVTRSDGDIYLPSVNFSGYSNWSTAFADFYGYTPTDTEPVSNGKVYIREEPIGGNSLTVSYPALPVSNSKAVSNYYYETYGDTFENSETVIDNRVYNNNTTTVYPITYSNDVPLWLVERTVDTPSLEVVSADYSLPSVELEEGDASFWQGLYEALPVSVSVILLGVLLCWLIFTLI